MTEFEQLKAAIDAKMSTNPQIRHILKLIESGKASFNDSAKYTQILSHFLGRELASKILGLKDREGTTSQLLRGAYDEVNDLCSQVQSSLDKKAGIGLNPKQAPFPAERVEQYAHSLVDPTVEDSVIKRRAGAGSETITKSYHDDFIETNAEFREDAGFKCYIIRMGTDCCQWCSDVAGKYEMKDQPQGIFRRHDNCDCTIIYDGQVLRGQTGAEGKRGKKWVEVSERAGIKLPTRYTPEQAAEIQTKNMSTGLTRKRRNDIIKVEEMYRRNDITHRHIGSEGQQIIDKTTYNKLTKDFIKNGGIIKNDQEAIDHLISNHAHAEYLPSFNTILTTKEPTVSDIIEETFHAKQDRLHSFGDVLTDEVLLRREIEAQEYLLSVTDKYKIPADEVEITKKNLADYKSQLAEYLKIKGGE